MSQPRAVTARLLAVAADLKAGGASWEQVAAKVGRSAAVCRRWPSLYPAAWRRLFRAAEEQLTVEAAAEAVLELRRLLRSEDEKVRREVARTLVGLRSQVRAVEAARPRAGPTDDGGRADEHYEGLDDAGRCQLTEDLSPADAGADAGAAAGGGEPEPD
jgi:hypothetical protein